MTTFEDLYDNMELIKLEKKLKKQSGGDAFIKRLRENAQNIIELDRELKEMAKFRQAVLSTRKEDEELNTAKRRVKGLNAPYAENLRHNTDNTRFIGLLIQEIEGFRPINNDEDEE